METPFGLGNEMDANSKDKVEGWQYVTTQQKRVCIHNRGGGHPWLTPSTAMEASSGLKRPMDANIKTKSTGCSTNFSVGLFSSMPLCEYEMC